MRVNYHKLERDIPEIAARVEEISGLNVPLDTLSFEVTDSFQYYNAGATYNTTEKKIRIYKNTIPPLLSQQTLKTILGHELMHHSQFSMGQFKQTVEDESVKNLHRFIARLVEGDATWVEYRLEQLYPLDVLSKGSLFWRRMELEYAGFFRGISGMTNPYGLGKRRIGALVATGGRAAVNHLYQSELQEIVENFSDSIMEKCVTSDERRILKFLKCDF